MANGTLAKVNYTLGLLVGSVAKMEKKQDEQGADIKLLLAFRNKALGYASCCGAIAGLLVGLLV